jgi:acylpyruvate hydrolase
MQLVTVRRDGATSAGRVEDGEIVLLPSPDVGTLITSGPDWAERAGHADGARLPLEGADLAPVVPRPPKIVCLGLNYLRHIREMGREAPSHPTLFAKFAGSLIGANDPIVLPHSSTMMDWEVELVVVIGLGGRHIPVASALDHVAGYTVGNDITARDWQRRTTQFLQGKTFDQTSPIGPWLVTPDELPAGAAGLEVRCEVNGVEMQCDTTAELIFDVAETIAYVSSITALEPGDVLFTGTPEGVGSGRTPPISLQPGDVVRTAIEGIGELRNECVAEQLPAV